jgi:hypothetical protein
MFDFIKRLYRKASAQPSTFEEAVDYVAERIEPTTVSDPFFHFSGGMNMRNSLGLWQAGSPLHRHMLERFGLCHADDTGSLISSAADAKKNGRAYDPSGDVERFRRHWRAMGMDPATMERIGS